VIAHLHFEDRKITRQRRRRVRRDGDSHLRAVDRFAPRDGWRRLSGRG
jgi:hypothetical protein